MKPKKTIYVKGKELKSEQKRKSSIPVPCKASSNLQLKIATFDGITSWTTHFTQFQRIAKANGLSEEQKTLALVAALRSDSLNIVKIMTVNEEMHRESLRNKMELRFSQVHLNHIISGGIKTPQSKAK